MKLSELVTAMNLTYSCQYMGVTTNDYVIKSRLFMVTISTTAPDGTINNYTGPFLTPYDNVIQPYDNKYHPRWGADVSDGPRVEGEILTNDWWFTHGLPKQPTLSDVVSNVANFAFFMKDIDSFEEYASLKSFNPDSIRALDNYQRDVALFQQIKDFLGTNYDTFIDATVDI